MNVARALRELKRTNWRYFLLAYSILIVLASIGTAVVSGLLFATVFTYGAFALAVWLAARRFRAKNAEDFGDRSALALAYSFSSILILLLLGVLLLGASFATGTAPALFGGEDTGALLVAVPYGVAALLLNFVLNYGVARLVLKFAIQEKRLATAGSPMDFGVANPETQ